MGTTCSQEKDEVPTLRMDVNGAAPAGKTVPQNGWVKSEQVSAVTQAPSKQNSIHPDADPQAGPSCNEENPDRTQTNTDQRKQSALVDRKKSEFNGGDKRKASKARKFSLISWARGDRENPARSQSRMSRASYSSSASMAMSGLAEIASITDYEKMLIKDIWSELIEKQPNVCELVYSRISSDFSQVAASFGLPQGEIEIRERNKIRRSRAAQLKGFIDRLIFELELEHEYVILECQELGRRHGMAYAPISGDQGPIPPESWPVLKRCILDEVSARQQDYDTEQREMNILAWGHFIGAVVQLVRESYEEEIFGEGQDNKGYGNYNAIFEEYEDTEM